jgi:hypothetical protein
MHSPHPSSRELDHGAMQPGPIQTPTRTSPASSMSCPDLILPPSLLLGTVTCMAPTPSKTWPTVPSWGRRRTHSHQEPSSETSGPRETRQPLRRTTSALSPTSPTFEDTNATANLVSLSPLSPEHVRPRPTRLSALIRYRSNDPAAPVNASDPQQTYVAYSPNFQPTSAPRSAPSVVTSFPSNLAHTASNATELSASPDYPTPYSAPTFPPCTQNSGDTWEDAILGNPSYSNRVPATFTQSPTTYFSSSHPPQPNPVPTTAAEPDSASSNTREFSTSSVPSAMQTPNATQGTRQTQPSNRQNTEGGGDGFTSPSEFALFVEATSSLSIVPGEPRSSGSSTRSSRSLNTSRNTRQRPSLTSTRIEAPLPPLPQSQIRAASYSSYSTPRPCIAATAPAPIPATSQSLTLPNVPQPFCLQRSASQPPPQTHIPNTSYPYVPPQTSTQGPISRSQMMADAILGFDDEAERPDDDELPDYATSQAEASQRARWEAARRAQELDEAWRRGRHF